MVRGRGRSIGIKRESKARERGERGTTEPWG